MLTRINYGERRGEVVNLPDATVDVMLRDGRALPYDDSSVSAVAPVTDEVPSLESLEAMAAAGELTVDVDGVETVVEAIALAQDEPDAAAEAAPAAKKKAKGGAA